MHQSLQLLLLIVFLNTFSTQTSDPPSPPRIPYNFVLEAGKLNVDAVTTFALDEAQCTLRPIGIDAVSSSGSKILQKMRAARIQSPQCYISPKKSRDSTVSCYCAASFFHKCITVEAMAESVYVWRRDLESRLFGRKPRKVSRSIEKIDCVLDAFQKIPPVNQTVTFYHHMTDGSDPKVVVKPNNRLPDLMMFRDGSAAISISVHCHEPAQADVSIKCNDDRCRQMLDLNMTDGLETFHVPFQVFLAIQEAAERKANFDGKDCPDVEKTIEYVSLLRSEVFGTIQKHLSLAPKGTLLDFAKHQLGWNLKDQKADIELSLTLISSFLIAFLFLCPCGCFCCVSCASCGDVYRPPYPATNAEVRNIESVIADQQRPAEELKGGGGQNGDNSNGIVADELAAMTMSQMGNMTDLGSEGTTGSSLKTPRHKSKDEDLNM